MPRLRNLPLDQWDPELLELSNAATGTPLEQGSMRIFAHAPGVAKGIMALSRALKLNRNIPHRLAELVRLRIAFHNQCRSCMAIRYRSGADDGVDEGLVCSLEKPEEAADLSASEKLALRFADKFANDHLAIDDDLIQQLREHYSEAEVVELGAWCAFCVGFGRLNAVWDMTDELPDSFKDKSRELTPWREEAILVRG